MAWQTAGLAGRKRENLGSGSAFAHELSLVPRDSIISEKCFFVFGNETVNIETRSVLQQDLWILFAGGPTGQFHGSTWFGVTLSGKSVSGHFGIFWNFVRSLTLQRSCSAHVVHWFLLEDAVGCA